MEADNSENIYFTSYRKLRWFAASLLFLSLALFVVSVIYKDTYSWMSWVRAFAEASLIGGLADWFAVTALFRHPLGIPIPHTAIIPKSQSRIAGTVARFVYENFLTTETLAGKLASINFADKMVALTKNQAETNKFARQFKDLFAGALKIMDEDSFRSFVVQALDSIATNSKLAPLVAGSIETIKQGDKNGKLLDELLLLTEKGLTSHKELLKGLLSTELPWYIPGFIKNHLYKQVTDAILRTAIAVRQDKKHPLRAQINHMVALFCQNLRDNPEWEIKLQSGFATILKDGALSEYLGNIRKILSRLIESRPESELASGISKILISLGQVVEKDPEYQRLINKVVSDIILRLVNDYGSNVGFYIQETMSNWEPTFLTQKVEQEVGADLQFIRINGTLVGGLLGLLIHAGFIFLSGI